MLRLMSPLSLLLMTLIAFVVAGGGAVRAQYLDQGRVVRVTTGSYEFKGWEQPLIQGNPNLSHFCWVPVTGYAQGRQRVVQRKGQDLTIVQSAPGRQQVATSPHAPVYVRPVHVPANYVASRPNPDSGKPIHVPTMVKPSTPEQDALHGAIRLPLPAPQPEVSAKLAAQQPDEAVSARLAKPVVAVYPMVAGSIYPRNGYGLVQGNLTSQSVHGRLAGGRKHK